MASNFDIKEIEMALNYMKKRTQATAVRLDVDDMGRLIMSATDVSACDVRITLYNNGPGAKMAEVSETKRLTND